MKTAMPPPTLPGTAICKIPMQVKAPQMVFGLVQSQPDDTKGALPYDVYIIDELPCANNEGKQLLTGIEITISRDKYTVNLGTLTNDNVQKKKPFIPQQKIVKPVPIRDKLPRR